MVPVIGVASRFHRASRRERSQFMWQGDCLSRDGLCSEEVINSLQGPCNSADTEKENWEGKEDLALCVL